MKLFELEFDPKCSCSLEAAQNLNVDFAHGCNTRGAMRKRGCGRCRQKLSLLAGGRQEAVREVSLHWVPSSDI